MYMTFPMYVIHSNNKLQVNKTTHVRLVDQAYQVMSGHLSTSSPDLPSGARNQTSWRQMVHSIGRSVMHAKIAYLSENVETV